MLFFELLRCPKNGGIVQSSYCTRKKGDIQDCNNDRGIKLLSHTMRL